MFLRAPGAASTGGIFIKKKMPEIPYFKRILEHSSNYADINKKRSEWDLNPRARKRTTAFRVRLVMTTSISLQLAD